MTLLQAYKKKRYDDGGVLNEGVVAQPKANIMQGFGLAASLGSGIIDATSKPDPTSGRMSTGSVVGKGALSGAAAGAQLGPLGALAGGVIGGAVGLLQSSKQKKEARQMLSEDARNKYMDDASSSNATLSTNPSLLSGYKNAGYFAAGGMMGGGPGDPPVKKKPVAPVPNSNTFTSQEEITAANQWTRDFLARHHAPQYFVTNAVVGRNVGDAKPKFVGGNGQVTPMGATTLPRDVNINMVENTSDGYGYFHPQNGNFVKVDPASIYSQYGAFKDMPAEYAAIEAKKKAAATVPANTLATTKTGFGDGGSIHIKPENRGKFNATKARTGKSTEELTHSSNPVTRKRAIFAQNAAKWHHANGGPMEAPLSQMYMKGGYAKSLSSENAELVGNSHANGGIDVQGTGIELEGKESTNGNFVFSDKLGFADEHKKIARSKGLIEKKPPTFERVNSMNRLREREQNLAMMQEFMKFQKGIQ